MPRPKGKVHTQRPDYRVRPTSSPRREGGARGRKLTTSVTLTADDLSALADYIAAGMVMLRVSRPHRAVSKFKAAMTRVMLPTTRGL